LKDDQNKPFNNSVGIRPAVWLAGMATLLLCVVTIDVSESRKRLDAEESKPIESISQSPPSNSPPRTPHLAESTIESEGPFDEVAAQLKSVEQVIQDRSTWLDGPGDF
jgi:hypothetical protein